MELDDNHRPVRVGATFWASAGRGRAVIYEEKDSGFFVKLSETQSGAFVLIEASDHETSEVWLLDRNDPDARPRLVEPRTPQLQYDVEHHGESLIIVTNADGAEDFKVVTAPVATPGRAHWRDLVPYRPGMMILSLVALARYIVRLEREDANPRIVLREIRDRAGKQTIAFDEDAYSLGFYARLRVRHGRDPLSLLVDDHAERGLGLRSAHWRADSAQAPGGAERPRPGPLRDPPPVRHRPGREQVPISLVHRREVALDGTAPCLLYGYGSYGMSMPAGFRTGILSLVDRGFVYAIAHIRGGTEKGWRWYLDGKREKKPNTFTDFIACGEALIDAGYTRADASSPMAAAPAAC